MIKKYVRIQWYVLAFIGICQFLVWIIPAQANAAETGMKIVGYLPDYDTKAIDSTIDFNQLTDVNYFAVVPQTNGTLNFTESGSPERLKTLVTEAHQSNVRVGVSIGGWGLSDNFVEATSEINRAKFIAEILTFVTDYQIDTVDIDWEYPEEEQADQYVAFIKSLKQALGEKTYLSICVPTGVASNGQATGEWHNHFKPEALREADWINIMAYDAQVSGAPHHSPVDLQKNSLNYWNTLMGGDQLGKLVGGIPFYGKAESGEVLTYSKIVADAPKVLTSDTVEIAGLTYYFNNKETVEKKVQDTIDIGALGVMVWAPTQDAEIKSSRRLMPVVINTLKANNVSLDKKEFTNKEIAKPDTNSFKWFLLVIIVALVGVGGLLFNGYLLGILPKTIRGKRVRRENLAKGVSVLAFLLVVVLLLFILLPPILAIGLLVASLAVLFVILRD